MALTIISNPAQLDNKAEWNITTSVTEDSTHVNVRVRVNVFTPSGIIAIIDQPKGSPVFDLTEILYRFISYRTPEITPSDVFAQQFPGKVGSNLITDWTNTDMVGYSDHGSNRVTFNHSGVNYGSCYSNSFAVTAGKLYCLILKTGTISGAGIADIMSYAVCIPYYLSTACCPTLGRYILFGVTSYATCRLTISAHSGVTTTWTGVDVELYELNPCDWYVPYDLLIAEVWESAAGVTSINYDGTITENICGRVLFKAPAIQTFSDYLMSAGVTKKFLMPDLYLSGDQARSICIMESPPAGQNSYGILMCVLDTVVVNVRAVSGYYNSSGAYVNDGLLAYTDNYHPVVAVKIGDVAYTTTRFEARIKMQTASATDISETFRVYLKTKIYEKILELIWLNSYGGFTTLSLSEHRRHKLISQKTEYEEPDFVYIKRRLAKARICYEFEGGSAILDKRSILALSDIICSEYVRFSPASATMKEGFVANSELPLEDNDSIDRLNITFQYAD